MRQHTVPTHLNWHPKRFIVLTGRQAAALALGAVLALSAYRHAEPVAPADGRPTVLPAPLAAQAPYVRLGVGALPLGVVGLATAANLPRRLRAEARYRRLPRWAVSRG